MRIPNRKLILLDRCLDSLPGNYGVVYQDFTNDVYEGLMQALKKLRKQNRLNIITEASSLYYTFIREGAERFCSDHGIPCEFYQAVTPDIVRPQEVYLILNGQLDTELIDLGACREGEETQSRTRYRFHLLQRIADQRDRIERTDYHFHRFPANGKCGGANVLDKQLRKVKCV